MKKRNFKAVHIFGFRGLFLFLFIISCLIAGFGVFPAFVSMNLWNYVAIKTGSFPAINFLQGFLLWAIIAFSGFVFSKKKFIVCFNAPNQELTDDEVKNVVSRIKEIKSTLKEDMNTEDVVSKK